MAIDADIKQTARDITAQHIFAFLLAREALQVPNLFQNLHDALVAQCTQAVYKHANTPAMRASLSVATEAELDSVFSLAAAYHRMMRDPRQE